MNINILVISTHPDDFEFGCGGTLLKFSKIARIYVLVITKGEIGGKPEVRQKEQQKVCSVLNAKLYWGEFKDTEVSMSKTLIDKIETVITEIKPSIIFSPYYEDTHQDHRNVAQATITATRYIRNVLFYESPTSIDFNPSVFVDIGEVLDAKLKLLKLHKSQIYATKVKKLSIIESAISTAIFRGYQNRVKYAEGFVPLRLALDFWISKL